MQTFRTFLAAAAVSILLAGCGTTGAEPPTLLPERQALANIHDIYRQEFAELFLSQRGEEPACLSSLPAGDQPSFSATRTAIRAYRVRFPDKAAELAHLQVLDAMMHLQVGNVGLASLLKSEVETAKGNLVSRSGRFTRDFLFAEYFDPLVEGWSVICDLSAAPPKEVDDPAGRLTQAAEDIGEGLTAASQSGQLAEPDADQGAVYLATTAAIFNVWALKESGQLCIEQGNCGCTADDEGCPTTEVVTATCASESDSLSRFECQQTVRRDYFDGNVRLEKYAESRDLIGRFLDDSEKLLAQCASEALIARSESSSRLRYVGWYKFFHDRLPQTAGSRTESCPS